MCNNVLWDDIYRPQLLPEEGVGWKVFAEQDGVLCAAIKKKYCYLIETDGWVRWKPQQEVEQGFCFFEDQEQALALAQKIPGFYMGLSHRNYVVKKIEYRQGLQKRLQYGILEASDRWTVCLCGAFRVVEEQTNGVPASC